MDRDRDRRYVDVSRGDKQPASQELAPRTRMQFPHPTNEFDMNSPDSRDRFRDRERDRDRDYDRDRDVERMGRGESYRPGRSLRSPGRDRDREREREDSYRRPAPSDTYIPGASRRPRSRSPRRASPPPFRRRSRSRSPPRRFREGSRERQRSPPRRAYSPRREDDRRDARPRSPPRFRERSPVALPKRTRDSSPYARERGYRSPPVKRERFESPRRFERYIQSPCAALLATSLSLHSC